MSDERHLQHQMQPCPVSCVCTSLAIIIGVDCSEVIEKFHDSYRAMTVSARQILEYYGVPFKTFDSLDGGSIDDPGAYLVTVPSLNITGSNHQIVIEMTDDDYHLIDPVKGRADRRYYVKRGQVGNDFEHELGGYIIDAFIPLSYIASAKP